MTKTKKRQNATKPAVALMMGAFESAIAESKQRSAEQQKELIAVLRDIEGQLAKLVERCRSL